MIVLRVHSDGWSVEPGLAILFAVLVASLAYVFVKTAIWLYRDIRRLVGELKPGPSDWAWILVIVAMMAFGIVIGAGPTPFDLPVGRVLGLTE